MGSRTIKKWLLKPLVDPNEISQRHEIVQSLTKNVPLLLKLSDLLAQISDLERIIGRIALDRAAVSDYILLKESLRIVPRIKKLIEQISNCILAVRIFDQLESLPQIVQLLESAISEELGANKSPIKRGFHAELDHLRDLVEGAEEKIIELELREIEKTGINSLKIRHNDIYGYTIEVTKPNVKLVPDYYILQQTLVSRNRYVTVELQKLEADINNAKQNIDELENKIFEDVKKKVLEKIASLRRTAQALATLDAFCGLANAAYENNYSRPEISKENRDILILEGRHPIVEQAQASQFIPNDTNLTDNQSTWIITGPNMGGKSTYLRQVALICLMAQAGSLVPAKSAKLPILDRIFTRIGSGDDLASGKSTFLVEMEETAVICLQSTKQSLVILDEVGRGTSTFDGMAIAQAIVEYIHTKIKARCLFATHYHELTELAKTHSGISNYMMKSKKTEFGIIFMHKITQGTAGGSFGIEVAKLAQLPEWIIDRAQTLVKLLNQKNYTPTSQFLTTPILKEECMQKCKNMQKKVEYLERTLAQLTKTHPDNLTPRQAHDLISSLWEEKSKIGTTISEAKCV